MSEFSFRKAEKRQAKLRLALDGPSGAGKTMTALITATAIARELGTRVAVIDSERGSASLYADRYDFDVLELHGSYDPARYVKAIRAAETAGYGVIVIDSLSHAWEAEGGVQEIADRNKKGGNTWSGWAAATPAYRSLVDAMLQSPAHIIATMRTKVEWTQDERGKPQKVGTSPVMRQGIDYEFTIVGDLDVEHVMRISKSRCPAVADKSYRHPGPEFGREVLAWLLDGAVDTRARAKELADLAPGNREALAAALKEAGIGIDALADDAVFEEAKGIARGVGPAAREAGAVTPAEGQVEPPIMTGAAAPPDPTNPDEAAADEAWAETLPVDVPLITEKQRRALFASAHEVGMPDDELRRITREVAGVESRSQIPQSRFEDLLREVKSWEAA